MTLTDTIVFGEVKIVSHCLKNPAVNRHLLHFDFGMTRFIGSCGVCCSVVDFTGLSSLSLPLDGGCSFMHCQESCLDLFGASASCYGDAHSILGSVYLLHC